MPENEDALELLQESLDNAPDVDEEDIEESEEESPQEDDEIAEEPAVQEVAIPELTQAEIEDDYADRPVKIMLFVNQNIKATVSALKKVEPNLPNGFIEDFESELMNVPYKQWNEQSRKLFVTLARGRIREAELSKPKAKPASERTPPTSNKKTNNQARELARLLGLKEDALDNA